MCLKKNTLSCSYDKVIYFLENIYVCSHTDIREIVLYKIENYKNQLLLPPENYIESTDWLDEAIKFSYLHYV